MELKRIETARILGTGPEANRYVFTYRPDDTALEISIASLGLITPPLLMRQRDGAYQIISGSRRIKVLRRLNWTGLEALVVPEDTWSDLDCLRRSLEENRWQRGFNEVEKALLFTRLSRDFPSLIPALEDLLVGELKLPRGPKHLETYRFVLDLPAVLQDGLAGGTLSMGQVVGLQRFPPEAHMPLSRLLVGLRPSLQESRNALAMIEEIVRRDGGTVEAFLSDEPFKTILRTPDPTRRTLQELLGELRRRRYPLQASWKNRMGEALNRAGLKAGGIRAIHDPNFEKASITFQFSSDSEEDLKEKIRILSESTEAGNMGALFRALSVDQDPDTSHTPPQS